MRYRALGSSGLQVSVVGLGCNNFGRRLDLAGTRSVLDAAREVGITFLDTADSYGGQGASESLLGELLAGHRDEVVLATKFGMDMQGSQGPAWEARGSRRYVRRAVEASLRRLRTDWIDLYQLHAPDDLTPMEETVAAMQELVSEGKVRYLGHSNLAGWQVVDAAWIARAGGGAPFISAQNEYSLLEREVERELVPACRAHGVGVLPYSPLANGLLTGKVTAQGPPPGSRLAERPAFLTEQRLAGAAALASWAEKQGRTLLEVAIGGLAAQPGVGSVMAGAMSAEQVRANAAAGEWSPDAAQLAELATIAAPGAAR